ncbi:MAG: neuraminidase-like domain-containing protein [Sphingopyxis sp.]|uniref:Tc toxin subunit A-related protein n=1 Tax=Sphingopyxis sp. TaxID=1908224 RepID=UPI002ABC8088|nr:neuraminidase-like domain-containing protein [Sphingopyxis sp.]MDZ3833117.1 neuraminidase-like domain-containing protein [Sphingopyxis sp.]
MVSLAAIAGPMFTDFEVRNPTFDLLTADLIHPDKVGALDWTGLDRETDLATMRLYQRVLRLSDSKEVAQRLVLHGLKSAHDIAHQPEAVFIDRYAGALGLNDADLAALHRRAVETKIRTRHLWAAFHNSIGSPHYMSGRMSNIDDGALDYLYSIPSYADFFGSLDYCSCEHCASMFGPAAYLADMLRVVVQYLDNATYNPDIPDGYHLFERRPDIENIPLTCAMTNDLVPFLQIVNEVLTASINQREPSPDVFFTLAGAPYPFALPFNLPLAQIRAYLNTLGSALWQVYEACIGTADGNPEAALPSLFALGSEAIGVSPTQYQVVSTSLDTAAAIGAQYGVPDGRILTMAASGTVTVTAASAAVTGTGTSFVSQVFPGDAVQIGAERRVVVKVDSDTALAVDSPWLTAASDAAMTIYPLNDLSWSVNFNYRTGLSFDQLQDLLVQDLDTAELAAGIADGFFINGANSAGQYLRTEIDRSDPAQPVNRIANQSLGTLDRLNRFVRLSRISGIAFKDLNLVLEAVGDTINANAIEALGGIALFNQRFRSTVPETLALVGDIATIGVKDPADPVDLFDRLFNSPGFLGVAAGALPPYTAKGTVSIAATTTIAGSGTDFSAVKPGMRVRIDGELRIVSAVDVGTNTITVSQAFTQSASAVSMIVYPSEGLTDDALPVYHPQYDRNPLYTDPLLQWTVDSRLDQRPETRGRLAAGLRVSDDDLTLIGQQGLLALGISDGIIPLTVPNMSLLYGYARMASLTGIPVASYLKLLDLIGITRIETLLDAFAVAEDASWLKRSGINPFALEYAMQGESGRQFDPGLTVEKIAGFLTTNWAQAAAWLMTDASFVNEDITADMSQAYYTDLESAPTPFINAYGVVLQVAIDFTAVAFVDPLTEASFVTPDISVEQSQSAFTELTAKGVLLEHGVLSSAFNRDTDLSYLFPEVEKTQREIMISQVRGILLLVKRRIEHVVEILETFGGAPSVEYPNHGTQQSSLCEQLGRFLSASTDRVLAIAPTIAQKVGPADYVAAFLQPPPSDPDAPFPPPDLVQFITILNRALVMARELDLSAAEIAAILRNPDAYGVSLETPPSLASVQSLWRFKTLTREFRDVHSKLIAYFEMPATGGCTADPKFALLASITGWSQAQICTLVQTFFATGTGYNTVNGIVRMQRVFDLCRRLGTDVNALLTLAQLNALPPTVTDESWASYNDASAIALGILKAKYTREEWPAAYRPVVDTLNSAKRDALAGYAIVVLQPDFPNIQTIDDLYTYLLIDVEMTGCADISYIKQAILSVQLYMQRARMMLEPGITKDPVPQSWWPWLSNYRTWEANRKIFLYPENYVQPELRKDKTPLFSKIQDGLSANEITPETVNDSYIEYFDGFAELAALQQVAAFYGPAPSPTSANTLVNTLFLIGRTATEPYTYYLQRQYDAGLWSAWEKIDATIGAPTVSPVHAFGRLFLFWVEPNNAAASQVSGGSAQSAQVTRASLRYSFINFSGRWTPPQTMTELVTNFDPMQDGYKTDQVDPATFVMSQIQWHKVSPLVLTGTNMADGAILIDYGQFFALPSGSPAPPTPPSQQNIPNPEAFTLATAIYQSSDLSVAATGKGMEGYTFVNPSSLIGNALNHSLTRTVMLNYGSYNGDQIYGYVPLIPRVVQPSGTVPTLRMAQIENLFAMDYVGQGAPYTLTPPTAPLPLLYNVSDRASITVPVDNQPFWYIFGNGDESFLVRSMETGIKLLSEITRVKRDMSGQTNETDLVPLLYSATPQTFGAFKWSFQRLSTGAATRMNRALFAGGVPMLLSVDVQVTPQTPLYPFSRFYQSPASGPGANTQPPPIPDGDTIDYDGPYGTYFWEIFFFTPWLVANQLQANQRFAEAQDWLNYIYDPTISADADPTAATPLDRFWRFVHFRDFTVETLLASLSSPAQLAVYNNDPFDPNAIARLRQTAYQKAIIMRYADNLLRWGDYEFTKDTWESITVATLLYTLALDLLGPRPVDVGPCSTQPPMTFADILKEYGTEIPQFLIGLENALPPVAPAATPGQADRYVPYNDLNTYFCAPENSELLGYWDQVEDRLFKIRNCMNIQGVMRPLALFEPPLDVNALVRAGAGGAGPQVAQQPQAGVLPYRFDVVIGIAKDFTSQLTQIGSQLLAAFEKKDAEALSRLRAAQELRILNMTTKVRQLQIDEITQNIAGLQISRQAADTRKRFYQTLLDTGLSPAERLSIASTVLAGIFSTTAGVMKTASAIAHLAPNVGSPFAMTYGGVQVGSSLDAAAAAFETVSGLFSVIGSVSLTVAGYERRAEEWQQQLTQAEFDIQVIDSQIKAAEIQLQSATQQLRIHEETIAQSIEVDNFLTSKFTNAELYEWMVGRLSGVYFQAYRVALEMAMGAELAFQYELNTTDSFISFAYWDGTHKGLLAGEQLMLSLNQMQKAYVERNTRPFEIEKTVSLLSLFPRAVMDLQNKGVCEFAFDEAMFDFDFAGQYARQIKSVSITIPALVGPYQNIHATLTQLGSQTLIKPSLNGVAFLLGQTAQTPDLATLRVNWRSNQQIALSTGIDDAGMFSLNFGDERYLPFEGTGAVSRWRLEMPKEANRIDYSTISDIVVKLRYTALAGGQLFTDDVRGLLQDVPYLGRLALNCALEFPSQWFAFLNPGSGATQQQFSFVAARSMLPANLTIGEASEIYVELQLGDGRSLDGTLIATLTIGSGSDATTQTLSFDNKTSALLANLTIADWVDQPWTLTVEQEGVPNGIKDPATGLIDPTALRTIGMIVTYEATRG